MQHGPQIPKVLHSAYLRNVWDVGVLIYTFNKLWSISRFRVMHQLLWTVFPPLFNQCGSWSKLGHCQAKIFICAWNLIGWLPWSLLTSFWTFLKPSCGPTLRLRSHLFTQHLSHSAGNWKLLSRPTVMLSKWWTVHFNGLITFPASKANNG